MPFVSIEDQRLEYVAIEGRPDAPTLLFLHEGLGSVSTWRDVPAAIAARTGCPAFVYSRAGYGASDPVELPRPLTYMHDEAFEVVPRLLEHFAIRDVVPVGHSDGGSIALLYASTDHGRERVRGLVLEAPHAFCESISTEAIARARDAYVHDDLREKLARHHEHVDVAFWGWNRAWLDPEFVHWNLEEHLARVVAPVLLIQGREDPYGTLAQIRAIADGVSGGAESLVLDACGHAPHKDQREATIDAIAAFVARLNPSS